MKTIFKFLIGLFLIGVLPGFLKAQVLTDEKSSETSPKLFLSAAQIFDFECSIRTGFKIEPSWQKELFEKSETFQAEWDKYARDLVLSSEHAAGRRFSRKEYSVALTLCGWTPMGDPAFIVSVLPYLGEPRKFKGFDMPLSMQNFISMTHHELLHSLVDNIINQEFSNTSEMIKKYETEQFNVLVHLHLMAIQKASYIELKANNLLKATDELYKFIGGDYSRAWEIVNAEGTEKFLSELRLYNQKK